MPLVPAGAPTPLSIMGPFATLTVDAPRRRVFAAGARSVAVIDAASGKLLATIRFGGARSLAVEPLGGHVFAGTPDGTIADIDPDRKTVVRSLAAGGEVDMLLYDATRGRLYAGGAGTALTIVDTGAFVPAGSIRLAGTPAGIAADPVTGEFYVAYRDRAEIAVVDPQRGAVRTSFPIAGSATSVAVAFDTNFGEIVVAEADGSVSTYDRAGTPVGSVAVPGGIAACDLDPGRSVFACVGSGGLTFVRLQHNAAPLLAATIPEDRPVRAAVDSLTHATVVVSANADGGAAAVGRVETAPGAP
jgi:DNA-binding beta-propeller fold protein YncE